MIHTSDYTCRYTDKDSVVQKQIQPTVKLTVFFALTSDHGIVKTHVHTCSMPLIELVSNQQFCSQPASFELMPKICFIKECIKLKDALLRVQAICYHRSGSQKMSLKLQNLHAFPHSGFEGEFMNIA